MKNAFCPCKHQIKEELFVSSSNVLEAIIGFKGSESEGERMIALLWGGLNLEQNGWMQTVLDILTWPIQILCWDFLQKYFDFFFLVANFKQWLWDYKMSYLKTDHWRVDSLENTQNRNTAEVLNCQNHTAYIILR